MEKIGFPTNSMMIYLSIYLRKIGYIWELFDSTNFLGEEKPWSSGQPLHWWRFALGPKWPANLLGHLASGKRLHSYRGDHLFGWLHRRFRLGHVQYCEGIQRGSAAILGGWSTMVHRSARASLGEVQHQFRKLGEPHSSQDPSDPSPNGMDSPWSKHVETLLDVPIGDSTFKRVRHQGPQDKDTHHKPCLILPLKNRFGGFHKWGVPLVLDCFFLK